MGRIFFILGEMLSPVKPNAYVAQEHKKAPIIAGRGFSMKGIGFQNFYFDGTCLPASAATPTGLFLRLSLPRRLPTAWFLPFTFHF